MFLLLPPIPFQKHFPSVCAHLICTLISDSCFFSSLFFFFGPFKALTQGRGVWSRERKGDRLGLAAVNNHCNEPDKEATPGGGGSTELQGELGRVLVTNSLFSSSKGAVLNTHSRSSHSSKSQDWPYKSRGGERLSDVLSGSDFCNSRWVA